MLRISNLSGFGAGVAGSPTSDKLLLESGDALLLEDGVGHLKLETTLIDPDFSNVALLVINGDGTDGNTDMVDQGPSSRTLTWVNETQVDTAIEKFSGKASVLFDGDQDYFHVPDHADFSLGTRDFTLEAWVYPTSIVDQDTIIAQYNTAGDQRAWHFHLTNGKPAMWFSPGGFGAGAWIVVTDSAVVASTWSWVVFQREGSDFRMWIDGTQDGTPTTKSTAIHNSTDVIKVGQKGSTDNFVGNLGPMRFTIDVARYPGAPSTIAVPTEPYPEI